MSYFSAEIFTVYRGDEFIADTCWSFASISPQDIDGAKKLFVEFIEGVIRPRCIERWGLGEFEPVGRNVFTGTTAKWIKL